MSHLTILGPSKLKGKIKIQGAKNSAMKHVFIPLITEDLYTLKNIPKIGSIDNHLELMRLLGSDVNWLSQDTLTIDSRKISKPTLIPKNLMYYTSGASQIIPLITSKFGVCKIEIDSMRHDYGGDQIGSRNFADILTTLKHCGITTTKKDSLLTFSLTSTAAFKFTVPNSSFTATILATFSALFKKGKSVIAKYTSVPEFADIVNYLIAAGAKIVKTPNLLTIYGPTNIKGISYTNMYDPHDLVTWIVASLSTNSKLTIEGVEYAKMKLDALEKTLMAMNVLIDLRSFTTTIQPQLAKIKPVNISAGQYPMFTTEWQVLFSPLLTQIAGESTVVETFFANRMQHWNELKKMGVHVNFFEIPNHPQENNHPRAVSVTGPQQLSGTKVVALDVRTGAALVVAGLIANGKTYITNIDNIERGYANIVERLTRLGVAASYST